MDIEKLIKERSVSYMAIPIIICIIAYIVYYYTEEQKAKRVVDLHLEAIMHGNMSDAWMTVNTGTSSTINGIFINVFEYKYLSTIKNEKILNDPMVLDRQSYMTLGFNLDDEFIKNHFGATYDEYSSRNMERYGERASRDGDAVIVQSDEYHYEFSFLYDVVVTNKIGHKLYKRYVFDVNPPIVGKYDYEIVNFHQK